MKYAILTLVSLMLFGACSESVTGVENGTARGILFTVTGSMKLCDYVSYTDSDSTSVIIDDCMVPFSVAVNIPADATIQITAGKRTDEGTITVMAIEDGVVFGYDTALGDDNMAWWMEGR